MSRPGFIRIPRTNGKPVVVRADMITAMLPNTVKEKGSGEEFEELTIQIGATITVHTRLTEAQIAAMVQNAVGLPMTIYEPA